MIRASTTNAAREDTQGCPEAEGKGESPKLSGKGQLRFN